VSIELERWKRLWSVFYREAGIFGLVFQTFPVVIVEHRRLFLRLESFTVLHAAGLRSNLCIRL
jgi:hypothetical protein